MLAHGEPSGFHCVLLSGTVGEAGALRRDPKGLRDKISSAAAQRAEDNNTNNKERNKRREKKYCNKKMIHLREEPGRLKMPWDFFCGGGRARRPRRDDDYDDGVGRGGDRKEKKKRKEKENVTDLRCIRSESRGR